MPTPYDLSPEEFRAMLDASLADQRGALAGQNYKRGAKDWETQQPGGRNLGYTYVASNPLEHLAAAIQRGSGLARMNSSQAEQGRQIDAKAGGLEAFQGAQTRNAPVPVDYAALLGEDPVSAGAAAQAMGGNVERDRSFGRAAGLLGGPFEGAGTQMGAAAVTGQRDLLGAGEHRSAMAERKQALLQSKEQADAARRQSADQFTVTSGQNQQRLDQDNWAGSPDPSGGVVLYNRRTGEVRRDGGPTPGGGIRPPNFKTEAQGKAFGYSERLTLGRKQMEDAGYPSGLSGRKDAAAMGAQTGPVSSLVPSDAASPGGEQYFNAARNVVAALLRKESGAAISDGEWKQFTGLYIPMPWDSPEGRANKLQMLDVMHKSLAGEAGPEAQRYWQQRVEADLAKAPAAPGRSAPASPGAAPAPRTGAPSRVARVAELKAAGKTAVEILAELRAEGLDK